MKVRYLGVLLLVGVTAAPALAAADSGREFVSLGHRLVRARVASDGSLWLLSNLTDVVRKYRRDGSAAGAFAPNASDGARPPHLVDFALGPQGNLLALFNRHATEEKVEAVVAKFQGDSGKYTSIFLAKPLLAWRIETDSSGDIYLLGLDAAIHERIVAGGAGGEVVHLLHRFDGRGAFKGSSLPMVVPESDAEFGARIFNPMVELANFQVERPGRVWFLQMVPDVSKPIWEWERTLHLATDDGSEAVTPQAPSEGFFPIGLHRDGGRVLLEWASSADPDSKLLTDTAGSPVRHFAAAGRLVACAPDSWYTVMHFGSNDNRILETSR